MARLRLISPGFTDRILVLHLGLNRIGRHPDNHFCIEEPSVSAFHCEIQFTGDHLEVRDCHSTNGTFVDGKPVDQRPLAPAQTLRLGSIECLVEDVSAAVAIPHIPISVPAPPKVREDGALACPVHETVAASHRCPKCRTVLCPECVRRLRRHAGKELLVCPACSTPVEPIPAATPAKRSLLSLLQTMKIPGFHPRKPAD